MKTGSAETQSDTTTGMTMRIGEVATKSGVSTRLLRYYEAQKLLTSTREANGYREYPAGTVERVTRIRSLVESGIPTAVIHDMLPCLDDVASATQPAITAEQAASLAERREQLEQRIQCLSGNRDAIAAYLDRARIVEPFPAPLG